MKKFEYYWTGNFDIENLNEFGKEGWELISVTDRLNVLLFFFKREIKPRKKGKAKFPTVDHGTKTDKTE
jgi:hypothetical protein